MIARDFNAILRSEYKREGAKGQISRMEDFRAFANDNSLMVVYLRRNKYTLSNNRIGRQLIRIRLDRILLSLERQEMFGDMILSTLPRIGLDHNPNLVGKGRHEILPQALYI